MALKDVTKILFLDNKVISKVSKDKNATKDASIIIILASLFSGALSYTLDINTGELYVPGLASSIASQISILLLALIFTSLLTIIFTWVISLVYRLFAKLMGGKGTVKSLYNVIGHGSALNVFSWIPFLSLPVLIYSSIVDIKIISVVEKIPLGRAIGVFLLAIFSVFIVLAVLSFLFLLFFYPGFTLMPSLVL